MSVFFIGFIIAVSFGVLFFFYSGDEVDLFSSNPNVVGVKKINKQVLTNMLGKMGERQKNFNELKINKPVVGDPGI